MMKRDTRRAAPNVTVSAGSLPLRARAHGVAPTARRASKRDKLLTHAREAFALYGFYGTQMAAVSLRAGLRKSTLFHYFTDKAALYEQAVCDHLLGLAHDLERTLPRADRAALLLMLVAQFNGALDRDPALGRLVLRELVDVPPAVLSAGEGLRRIVSVFASAVPAIEGGALADADAVALRIITMACLHRVDAIGPRAEQSKAGEASAPRLDPQHVLTAAQFVDAFHTAGL